MATKTKFNIKDKVTTPFGEGIIKEIKLYNKKVYYVVVTNSIMLTLKENKINLI